MDVCVLGLGQIGLPLAVLAAQKHDVVGVDIDETRIAAIERGDLPTSEAAIDELYTEVRDQFDVSVNMVTADCYIIVTPTPLRDSSHTADLSAVTAASEMIATELAPGDLVVLTSTVPPGTTDRVLQSLFKESGLSPGEFSVVYCPERALPGNVLTEITYNDRLIGAFDGSSASDARAFYESFTNGDIKVTGPKTAEFVKLIENTYRDVNIALANEFALIAEELGVNVHEAITAANRHPRVTVHQPGPGTGGHCLPIDPQLLAQWTTHDRLISEARRINDTMSKHVFNHVQSVLDEPVEATITVFGIAYKGNVGDTRKTPAQLFINLARNAGWNVRAYDPHVDRDMFDGELVDVKSSVDDSNCIVILTDHDEFSMLAPETFADRMANRTIVDTRAVIDRERWANSGFDIHILGDGT